MVKNSDLFDLVNDKKAILDIQQKLFDIFCLCKLLMRLNNIF